MQSLLSFSAEMEPDLSAFPPSATKASIVSVSSLSFAIASCWLSKTCRNSPNSISPAKEAHACA